MDSTGKTTRTLIGEVNEYLADKGEPSAYMVHRIDFNTSGLMVIAKDEESKGILDRMIKERELEKVYLCIVSGVPKKKEGHLIHYLRTRNREKYFCLMFRKRGEVCCYRLSHREDRSEFVSSGMYASHRTDTPDPQPDGIYRTSAYWR